RIGQFHRTHRLDEGIRVVELAAGLLQRLLEDLAVDVEGGVVEPDADVGAVIFADRREETLVVVGVDVERVRDRRIHADRLVAETANDGVIGEGRAADDGLLQPDVLILLHEAQRIGTGETGRDHVAVRYLRDEGRVVGRRQRRPDLPYDLATALLE